LQAGPRVPRTNPNEPQVYASRARADYKLTILTRPAFFLRACESSPRARP